MWWKAWGWAERGRIDNKEARGTFGSWWKCLNLLWGGDYRCVCLSKILNFITEKGASYSMQIILQKADCFKVVNI